MALEHIRTWQVGDVSVSRIVQLWNYADNIQMTMPEATAKEVIAMDWLHPHYATPDGQQLLNFQCFVVRTPTLTVMIDTCIGNDREREYDVFNNLQTSFLEDLAAVGVKPEGVDVVVCTHMHHDHVGWNTHLRDGAWVPTFPNARYLFSKLEKEGWDALRVTGEENIAHLVESFDPIVEAGLAHFVDAGFRISEELTLAPSHGHTPGHVHVCIESKGERGVITGDLMHHPMQCAMPHRIATFDMDQEAGRATRAQFVDKYKDSDVLVIGSHFADPTAGWIRSDGDDVRFFGMFSDDSAA